MNKKHGPWYEAEVSWTRNSDGELEMSTGQVTLIMSNDVALRLANWILGTSGEMFK